MESYKQLQRKATHP